MDFTVLSMSLDIRVQSKFSDLLRECDLLMNKTCLVPQAVRGRVSDFHSDDPGGL